MGVLLNIPEVGFETIFRNFENSFQNFENYFEKFTFFKHPENFRDGSKKYGLQKTILNKKLKTTP
jgi:hypothetical protein